jgi:hypothetical protein
LAIVKKASVKFEQALLTSNSSFINFSQFVVIDSDTIEIDRQISDHDGTCVTFKCGFSNQKTFQRTIWDYKNETKNDWEKLINDELDVNNACSNVTDAFLTIAKECIPTREVTIRTDVNICIVFQYILLSVVLSSSRFSLIFA